MINYPALPWQLRGNANSSPADSQQEIMVGKEYHRNDLKEGQLKLNYGGGKLNLAAGSDAWLRAQLNGGLHTKSIEADNNILKVTLKGTEKEIWQFGENDLNDRLWSIKIAPELIWRIDANIGYVEVDMDITNVKPIEMDSKLVTCILDI